MVCEDVRSKQEIARRLGGDTCERNRSLARHRSVNDDIAFATILAIIRTCAETVMPAPPKMCARKTLSVPAGRSAVLLSPLRRCTCGALFAPLNM
ncbi:hypothetical protein OH687_33695 [Burkholderia anthina]|nr:hypothetical protein OH687_33695 [Burkholderia anthina]